MPIIRRLFVLVAFAAVIGCSESPDSKQSSGEPQSEAETAMEMSELSPADSIMNDLEQSSQELKSAADEAQKAVEDLASDY